MAVPILKVPVDDSAFQRYLATFQKYQEALKQQPSMWADIGESAASFAVAGAAMADEIQHQAEATEQLRIEEEKRQESIKRAQREKERADRAEADREKAAATRRREAIAQIKEYASRTFEVAKMVGGTVLGAALGGGLSLYGLDRIAAGVGDQRRSAQGLGVTVGEQQGLNLTASRYFDVNSTLSNVANAKASPDQWYALRMLGINPNSNQDPAKMTEQAAISARRMFMRDKGNLALAGAQGLTQIFSPEDLRRLTAQGTSENDIRKSFKQANENAGFADSVGKKWQDLSIRIEKFGLVLENVLITKLTALAGPVGDVLDGFESMALNFFKALDFKAIGESIHQFGIYIQSPDIQTGFKGMVEGFKDLIPTIKELGEVLEVIMLPFRAAHEIGAGVGSIAGDIDNFGNATKGSGARWIEHGLKWLFGGTGANSQQSQISGIEKSFNLPANLLAGVFGAESAFGANKAMSSAGARGPFQMMPDAMRRFGVYNPADFGQESQAAAKYLTFLLKMFHGNQAQALAGYNWGEGNVKRDIAKHGADWLAYAPKETQDYVNKILALQSKAGQSAKPAGANVKVTTTVKNQTGASIAHQANAAVGG